MSAPVKPLAKSLHTVSVIVRVARYLLDDAGVEQAVANAIDVLGYHDAPDPYGLAAAALKQMAV